MTVLRSPTARFAWSLATNARSIAVAAMLTQLKDAGRQHPIAYESRTLTAAEHYYLAHVLDFCWLWCTDFPSSSTTWCAMGNFGCSGAGKQGEAEVEQA